jgi:hypothetical protein
LSANRITEFQFPSLKAVWSCTSTLLFSAGLPYPYFMVAAGMEKRDQPARGEVTTACSGSEQTEVSSRGGGGVAKVKNVKNRTLEIRRKPAVAKISASLARPGKRIVSRICRVRYQEAVRSPILERVLEIPTDSFLGSPIHTIRKR